MGIQLDKMPDTIIYVIMIYQLDTYPLTCLQHGLFSAPRERHFSALLRHRMHPFRIWHHHSSFARTTAPTRPIHPLSSNGPSKLCMQCKRNHDYKVGSGECGAEAHERRREFRNRRVRKLEEQSFQTTSNADLGVASELERKIKK
jgi:hypothetical protein